jgi:NAD(P)-dependent dehydrogenase (short-subunit alcohol dehydrogenase family)
MFELPVDVASETQVTNAVSEAEQRFGGPDTIIANAGILLFGQDTVATELTWKSGRNVST